MSRFAPSSFPPLGAESIYVRALRQQRQAEIAEWMSRPPSAEYLARLVTLEPVGTISVHPVMDPMCVVPYCLEFGIAPRSPCKGHS